MVLPCSTPAIQFAHTPEETQSCIQTAPEDLSSAKDKHFVLLEQIAGLLQATLGDEMP